MALIEPGPFEKFTNWLKNLKASLLKPLAPRTKPKDDGLKVIWSKKLSKDRWIEANARADGMLSFRELKRVQDGAHTFNVTLFESGLYNDRQAIVDAVLAHLPIAEGREH